MIKQEGKMEQSQGEVKEKKNAPPRWYCQVQVTPEEKAIFKACAKDSELNVSQWFRSMAKKAVEKWKASKQ